MPSLKPSLLSTALLQMSLLLSPHGVASHGTMVSPAPRQPESVYWYQVGCSVGCKCTGGGKERYPSLASMDCDVDSGQRTISDAALSWNVKSESPRGSWNDRMPWRSPGSAVPLDSCGIASGFLPDAKVQYPHTFGDNVAQGTKGTDLPQGEMVTRWEAGSVVEASYWLSVNHGGGYQYRVCRSSTETMDESCFVPLAFATDTHIVELGSHTNDKKKTVTIPATDVTEGVSPAGSTWRRIPLPACNCDSGAGCDGSAEFSTSYNTNSKPHGTCTTGLQFEAPHITDGSWPEGYGYYVSNLGGGGTGKGETSRCESHKDAQLCGSDVGCQWYGDKSLCYETDGAGKEDTTTTKDTCYSLKDKTTCVQTKTNSGGDCTWYESEYKTVCYDKGDSEKRRLAMKEATTDYNWHITDRLYAPSEPGEYVLQWRWDNEQTPQIWTTCADIEVVVDGSTSSGGKRMTTLARHRLVVVLMAAAFAMTM